MATVTVLAMSLRGRRSAWYLLVAWAALLVIDLSRYSLERRGQGLIEAPDAVTAASTIASKGY